MRYSIYPARSKTDGVGSLPIITLTLNNVALATVLPAFDKAAFTEAPRERRRSSSRQIVTFNLTTAADTPSAEVYLISKYIASPSTDTSELELTDAFRPPLKALAEFLASMGLLNPKKTTIEAMNDIFMADYVAIGGAYLSVTHDVHRALDTPTTLIGLSDLTPIPKPRAESLSQELALPFACLGAKPMTYGMDSSYRRSVGRTTRVSTLYEVPFDFTDGIIVTAEPRGMRREIILEGKELGQRPGYEVPVAMKQQFEAALQVAGLPKQQVKLSFMYLRMLKGDETFFSNPSNPTNWGLCVDGTPGLCHWIATLSRMRTAGDRYHVYDAFIVHQPTETRAIVAPTLAHTASLPMLFTVFLDAIRFAKAPFFVEKHLEKPGALGEASAEDLALARAHSRATHAEEHALALRGGRSSASDGGGGGDGGGEGGGGGGGDGGGPKREAVPHADSAHAAPTGLFDPILTSTTLKLIWVQYPKPVYNHGSDTSQYCLLLRINVNTDTRCRIHGHNITVGEYFRLMAKQRGSEHSITCTILSDYLILRFPSHITTIDNAIRLLSHAESELGVNLHKASQALDGAIEDTALTTAQAGNIGTLLRVMRHLLEIQQSIGKSFSLRAEAKTRRDYYSQILSNAALLIQYLYSPDDVEIRGEILPGLGLPTLNPSIMNAIVYLAIALVGKDLPSNIGNLSDFLTSLASERSDHESTILRCIDAGTGSNASAFGKAMGLLMENSADHSAIVAPSAPGRASHFSEDATPVARSTPGGRASKYLRTDSRTGDLTQLAKLVSAAQAQRDARLAAMRTNAAFISAAAAVRGAGATGNELVQVVSQALSLSAFDSRGSGGLHREEDRRLSKVEQLASPEQLVMPTDEDFCRSTRLAEDLKARVGFTDQYVFMRSILELDPLFEEFTPNPTLLKRFPARRKDLSAAAPEVGGKLVAELVTCEEYPDDIKPFIDCTCGGGTAELGGGGEGGGGEGEGGGGADSSQCQTCRELGTPLERIRKENPLTTAIRARHNHSLKTYFMDNLALRTLSKNAVSLATIRHKRGVDSHKTRLAALEFVNTDIAKEFWRGCLSVIVNSRTRECSVYKAKFDSFDRFTLKYKQYRISLAKGSSTVLMPVEMINHIVERLTRDLDPEAGSGTIKSYLDERRDLKAKAIRFSSAKSRIDHALASDEWLDSKTREIKWDCAHSSCQITFKEEVYKRELIGVIRDWVRPRNLRTEPESKNLQITAIGMVRLWSMNETLFKLVLGKILAHHFGGRGRADGLTKANLTRQLMSSVEYALSNHRQANNHFAQCLLDSGLESAGGYFAAESAESDSDTAAAEEDGGGAAASDSDTVSGSDTGTESEAGAAAAGEGGAAGGGVSKHHASEAGFFSSQRRERRRGGGARPDDADTHSRRRGGARAADRRRHDSGAGSTRTRRRR